MEGLIAYKLGTALIVPAIIGLIKMYGDMRSYETKLESVQTELLETKGELKTEINQTKTAFRLELEKTDNDCRIRSERTDLAFDRRFEKLDKRFEKLETTIEKFFTWTREREG